MFNLILKQRWLAKTAAVIIIVCAGILIGFILSTETNLGSESGLGEGDPVSVTSDLRYISLISLAEPSPRYWKRVLNYVNRILSGESKSRYWELEREVSPNEVTGFQRIYEVTHYPDAEQFTAKQKLSADSLVRRTFNASLRHGWFDFEKAQQDGFKLMFSDRIHYMNQECILDDKVLDPNCPEFLMFFNTPVGMRLAAAMYLMRNNVEHGAQTGGSLTVWHYHLLSEPMCFLAGRTYISRPDEEGTCPLGISQHKTPEMLHVWFVDHPQGRFATEMGLPSVKQLSQPGWPPDSVPSLFKG